MTEVAWMIVATIFAVGSITGAVAVIAVVLRVDDRRKEQGQERSGTDCAWK